MNVIKRLDSIQRDKVERERCVCVKEDKPIPDGPMDKGKVVP